MDDSEDDRSISGKTSNCSGRSKNSRIRRGRRGKRKQENSPRPLLNDYEHLSQHDGNSMQYHNYPQQIGHAYGSFPPQYPPVNSLNMHMQQRPMMGQFQPMHPQMLVPHSLGGYHQYPSNSIYSYHGDDEESVAESYSSKHNQMNSHPIDQDCGSVKSFKSRVISTKDIVLFLLPRNNCSIDEVISHFKCNFDDAKSVLVRNRNVVRNVSSTAGEIVMELSPNIEICPKYLDEGCYDQERCSKIHICIDYLVNNCKVKNCDLGHSLRSKHNSSIWKTLRLESCTDYTLKSIMELVMSKRSMAVCEEYNYGQCSKAEKCWMLHICKEFIDKHDECKSDCNLNHDILMDQCSKVLKMHKIEVEDSRRDVLIRVQKILEQIKVDSKSSKTKKEFDQTSSDISSFKVKINEQDNQKPILLGLKIPASGDKKPASGDKKPASGDKKPASGLKIPASGDKKPASGDKKPASGNKKPASGDKKPASGDKKPASGDKKPASGDKKPASGDKKPASGDKKPASGDKKPASGDKKPASGDKKPASGDKKPAHGDKKFAPGDKNPVTTEKKPVATEKKPLAVEKMPVATEKKPVTAEQKPMPAEKKPMPAEKKPVPTEKKPVPTEKKPVPAEKKPVTTKKKPVTTEKKPVGTEKKPVATEKKPVPAEKKPVTTKKKTVTTEKKPVATEKKRLVTEKKPVAAEKKTAAGDKKPVCPESNTKITVPTYNVIPSSFNDLDCQNTRTILHSLFYASSFSRSSAELKEGLGIELKEIENLVKQCNKLFMVYKPSEILYIKFNPQLNICASYATRGICNSSTCKNVHVCLDYVRNNCTKELCVKSHHILNDHNSSVFQPYLLDKLSPERFKAYLGFKYPIRKLPKICLDYVSGRCVNEKCSKLHVCYEKLFTGTYCFSSSCNLNHDLFSLRNQVLFVDVMLSEYDEDNIKSSCMVNLPAYIPTLKVTSASLDVADSYLSNGVELQSVKQSFSEMKFQDEDIETYFFESNDNRCFSHDLICNVRIAEICLDYLEKSGICDDKSCGKLHSRVSQHWQFQLNENWYNFLIPHSNQIERDYRDPSKNASVMKRKVLEYGKTVFDKVKLKVMNTNDLTIDFDKMVVSSANTGINIPVHRISTKSVAETQSTFGMVYGWYFLDKLMNWIEYGFKDSTEGESHFATIGSKEIEQHYINKKESILILTDRFKYILNFKEMYQINTETKVVRGVCRRPKFALVEKINPDDPFNFKRNVTESPHHPDLVNSNSLPTQSAIKSNAQAADCPKYPKYWQNIKEDSVELVTVEIDSEEENDLIQKILFFIPNADVSKVIRVQNTFMWEKFSLEMDRIKKKSDKKNLNIQQLYYGTNVNNIQKISKRNFEWREDFADSGAQYGRGAYFYNSAAEAYKQGLATTTDPVQCPVVLAVAQVFIGSIVKGDSTMRKEPMVQITAGSDDVRYHNTAVNDLDKPEIFVKFNKDEICPLYFIHLKRTSE